MIMCISYSNDIVDYICMFRFTYIYLWHIRFYDTIHSGLNQPLDDRSFASLSPSRLRQMDMPWQVMVTRDLKPGKCLDTLQGTNISRPGKRKIMFKSALGGDMLVYRMAKLPCLLQFHGFLWGCVSSVQNLKDTNSLAVVFGTNWCVEDWLVNFSGVKSLVKNFQFASFIPVLTV